MQGRARSYPDGLVAVLLVGLFASGAGAQVPEPPARYDGPATVEGYNAAILFQRWVNWVEGRKASVLEAALAEPERVEGFLRRGTMLEARASSDTGLGLVADISNFCPVEPGSTANEGCRPRMREITIPLRADGHGGGPLADWTRQAFDAAAVVQALKAADVSPESDLWRVETDAIFTQMASPVESLRAGLRVRTIDALACPAMEQALDALEGRTLDWRVDLWGVGQDALPSAPRPHAARWSYRLRFLADDLVTIDAGQGLTSFVSPPFAAGEACFRTGD